MLAASTMGLPVSILTLTPVFYCLLRHFVSGEGTESYQKIGIAITLVSAFCIGLALSLDESVFGVMDVNYDGKTQKESDYSVFTPVSLALLASFTLSIEYFFEKVALETYKIDYNALN